MTARRLLELVIVPDRVQLIVNDAGQGAVWVMVSLNGSLERVVEPRTSVMRNDPSVLLPLLVIVAADWG